MRPNHRYKSDIPDGVTQKLVKKYREKRSSDGVTQAIYLREEDCLLQGVVVGKRFYDKEGELCIEQPLKDNLLHGRVCFFSDGWLELIEPYFEGMMHGVAKQYDQDGKLLGTYRMSHGTGLDIWRCRRADGSVGVAEIHSMKHGTLHGYEWWFDCEDGRLWSEAHWHAGRRHGIERNWIKGKRSVYSKPIFWINDEKVTKREYVKACETDKTLPPYRDVDDLPARTLPSRVQKLLGIASVTTQ